MEWSGGPLVWSHKVWGPNHLMGMTKVIVSRIFQRLQVWRKTPVSNSASRSELGGFLNIKKKKQKTLGEILLSCGKIEGFCYLDTLWPIWLFFPICSLLSDIAGSLLSVIAEYRVRFFYSLFICRILTKRKVVSLHIFHN